MPKQDEYDHLPIGDALRKMADHHHGAIRRHITRDERDLLNEAADLLDQAAPYHFAFTLQVTKVNPLPPSPRPPRSGSVPEGKQSLLTKIAQVLGVEAPKIAPGSTVTKEIFLLVNEVLGLSLDGDLSKPELARAIVETGGHDWLPSHESEGGTITAGGLQAVLAAVETHVGAEPKTKGPKPTASKAKGATERLFGHVPGIWVGTEFPDRRSVSAAGVHRPTQAGISGSSTDGADSIVVSGGYIDDSDSGDRIIYTGHGGNDPITKRQVADQQLTRGNQALVISHNRGLPVRVVRGWKGNPAHSPDAGYRYDGLYSVARYWSEVGVDGYVIWRYELHQRDD
jgi:hypothetical protein